MRVKTFPMFLPVFFTLIIIVIGDNVWASSEEGQKIFQQKCVACHTVGGGKKVGPDLQGVTERRDLPWLQGFIKSPPAYFANKDETATALLAEYGIPMPALGLTDGEVHAVIAYLKGSEPKAAGTTVRPSQFIPVVIIALGVIVLLTVIALIAGAKKVEVRG